MDMANSGFLEDVRQTTFDEAGADTKTYQNWVHADPLIHGLQNIEQMDSISDLQFDIPMTPGSFREAIDLLRQDFEVYKAAQNTADLQTQAPELTAANPDVPVPQTQGQPGPPAREATTPAL